MRHNLCNETSCFDKIMFITEDAKVKHTNITTKLKMEIIYKSNYSAKLIGLGSFIDRESN